MNTLPTDLVESIRAELLKLVQGDLDKNLVAIGKLSSRARDLFMVLKNPEAAVKGRRISSYEDGEDSYSSSGTVMSNPGSLNGSAETFGAKAIREIIGVLPSLLSMQNETPSSLVIAASIARDRGMTDLSAEIERKLVGRVLEGDRPIDKDRMLDIAAAASSEGSKVRASSMVGGIVGVLSAATDPLATPIPPVSTGEEEDEEACEEGAA